MENLISPFVHDVTWPPVAGGGRWVVEANRNPKIRDAMRYDVMMDWLPCRARAAKTTFHYLATVL